MLPGVNLGSTPIEKARPTPCCSMYGARRRVQGSRATWRILTSHVLKFCFLTCVKGFDMLPCGDGLRDSSSEECDRDPASLFDFTTGAVSIAVNTLSGLDSEEEDSTDWGGRVWKEGFGVFGGLRVFGELEETKGAFMELEASGWASGASGGLGVKVIRRTPMAAIMDKMVRRVLVEIWIAEEAIRTIALPSTALKL
jgi:hypothetical protein